MFDFLHDRSLFERAVADFDDVLIRLIALIAGLAILGISGKTVFLVGLTAVVVLASTPVVRLFVADAYRPAKIQRAAFLLVLLCLAGSIPVIPYKLLEVGQAFSASIVGAFVALFVAGLLVGRRNAALWDSIRSMILVVCASVLAGTFIAAFIA